MTYRQPTPEELSEEVYVDNLFNLNAKDQYCYVLLQGVRERSTFNKNLDFIPKLINEHPTSNLNR